MSNNVCPKCGYEYNEGDIYCAKCGNFLHENEEDNPKNNSQDIALENFNTQQSPREPIKHDKIEFFNSSRATLFDNSVFNFLVYILLITSVLFSTTYFFLNNHEHNKIMLKYKNLVNNPQQIPALREPSSLKDLVYNFNEVEDFLTLYLIHSENSQGRKEQIFSSFLNEFDKLPHITNESLLTGDSDSCNKITSNSKLKFCSNKIKKQTSSVGINVFSLNNVLYFYPDYKFIEKKYSKFLSSDMKNYIALRAKYNIPVSLGVDLYIKPKKLADKLCDFEALMKKTNNDYIKEKAQYIVYNDFKKFIFIPSIYETTTHEMKSEFKNAYAYFINNKKHSDLRPVVMNYVDKQKFYTDENFTNDYPFKASDLSFEENVKNTMFQDVFYQLRKSIFSTNSQFKFAFVFNSKSKKWHNYTQNMKITPDEYVVSLQDENNNVSIFNSSYSLMQELNVLKDSELFLVDTDLYVFNRDKLAISKVMFNGKVFILTNLSSSDIMSVFPGIDVINIDSYSSYNILIEKDNTRKAYIILSRYSQGFASYVLTPLKGEYKQGVLPNIFIIDGVDDVVLSFKKSGESEDDTAQESPAYNLIIKTRGYYSQKQAPQNPDYVDYDSETANSNEEEIDSEPNIMPKILNQNEENNAPLPEAPKQQIEPPKDSD